MTDPTQPSARDELETQPGTAATPRPHTDVHGDTGAERVGRIVGDRYRLDRLIAQGGMASVWQAHDAVLARTVAIKLLHAHLAVDDGFRERFRREAVSAAKLSHPNIVGLYDTGSEAGRVYLVMEFVDGVTLRDVLADTERLDPGEAAFIAQQVARALEYAHRHGIVHRDVKPANILLGGDSAVKIADFGIAKAEEADDLTHTGTVLGTAAYLAPEQVLAQPVDGKADQYALGCVLYEMLTGRPPFTGDTAVSAAAARLEARPLPVRSLRPDVPKTLDAVVTRMLARDPNDRFPDVEAVAEALLPFASGGDGAAPAERGLQDARRHESAARPDDGGVDTAGHGESFLRSEGRWLAPVGLLLVLAALLLVGGLTGVLPAPSQLIGGEEPPPTADPVPLGVVNISSFDPFGRDGENDERLPNLLDGDESTAWRTQLYDSAPFGRLKPGVGFWVDLGGPQQVTTVVLRTATPGISYELRTADEPADDIDGWRPLAGAQRLPAGALEELELSEPLTARYLLVWITGELQPHEGRFAAVFTELAILGPADAGADGDEP